MARLARPVVAGLPHHVTQRGNRREPIFFEGGDQEGRNASTRYLYSRFCFVLSCAMTRSAIGISVSEIDLKIAPKLVHEEGYSRRMGW
jgi:hypothetical protein